jgi:hypothetical protein
VLDQCLTRPEDGAPEPDPPPPLHQVGTVHWNLALAYHAKGEVEAQKRSLSWRNRWCVEHVEYSNRSCVQPTKATYHIRMPADMSVSYPHMAGPAIPR